MPEQRTLTQEQALKLLINAVIAAQQKGAYSLEEAAVLHAATQVFTKKPEESTPVAAAAAATTT